MIDGRCVISRGIGNHTWIPRICNPTELVIVECGKRTEAIDQPRKYRNDEIFEMEKEAQNNGCDSNYVKEF